MTYKFIMPTLFIAVMTSTAFAAGNHSGGHADSEAIGKPGKAADVKRTITVNLLDTMRFTPDNIRVEQGETIRFIVKNTGIVKHEMVLGTEKELKDHNEMMKKNPDMEHADDNQVTVKPGKSAEIIWRFTQAGKVDFACLQPGHYDAGMAGSVSVRSAKDTKHSQEDHQLAQGPMATDNMTDGEIKKIDRENKKITIKHGEIRSLDMPGMTMVFQIRDASLLEAFKAGDKVKFMAAKSDGTFVVTSMQLAN